jgi:hypothetical protein
MDKDHARIEELLELMESYDQDDRIWLEQELDQLSQLKNATGEYK